MPSTQTPQRGWVIPTFFIGGGAVLLIIVVVAISNKKTEPSNPYTPSRGETRENLPPVEADAWTMFKEFGENEVRALDKYKGKRLSLMARVITVEEDAAYLGTSKFEYMKIQCRFSDQSVLREFNSGDLVIVEGTCTGKSGFVMMEKCRFDREATEKTRAKQTPP